MSKFTLIFCLMLSACCAPREKEIMIEARMHAEKLRLHFGGQRMGDISSLIAETKAISTELKKVNQCKLANKFDSYIDVLSFGNRTLEESVNDMKDLVEHGLERETESCCIQKPSWWPFK